MSIGGFHQTSSRMHRRHYASNGHSGTWPWDPDVLLNTSSLAGKTNLSNRSCEGNKHILKKEGQAEPG